MRFAPLCLFKEPLFSLFYLSLSPFWFFQRRQQSKTVPAISSNFAVYFPTRVKATP
jgi:hypothetical protein